MTTPLQLQPMHSGIAPSWWPPAPGWWLLAAIMLVAIAALAGWRLRKHRRQTALLHMFDEAVDRAETPSEQVAAMSELLRRAARGRDSAADRLEGAAWLHFLDEGMQDQPFSSGAGALLREGGFRADVAVDEVAALRIVARQRYLLWMQRR